VNLAEYLAVMGVKAEAGEVCGVIKQALRDPAASPSELVDALALSLNAKGASVIADREDDGAAAAKVVAFLVERGELRIEGRRVSATEKFAGK